MPGRSESPSLLVWSGGICTSGSRTRLRWDLFPMTGESRSWSGESGTISSGSWPGGMTAVSPAMWSTMNSWWTCSCGSRKCDRYIDRPRPALRRAGAAAIYDRIQFFRLCSTATATATVAPTMGLLPMPKKPIISTWAGTEEEPANWASECIRPMVSVMP